MNRNQAPSSETNSPTPDVHINTRAVKAGRPGVFGAPLNVPIVPASNYLAAPQGDGPLYSRGESTEGVLAFEAGMEALEGGHAVAFSSGMAAISAVFDTLGAGTRIMAPDDLYQGVARVLADGVDRLGWSVTRLRADDTQAWLDRVPHSDFIWIESPTNPRLDVAEVDVICESAIAQGVPVVVDNTFATPLGQQPLTLGATYSVHSATKFIGGHSDLLAGVVMAATEDAVAPIRERRVYGGATIGALEAYLALRGLRTLPLRWERGEANALELARRLQSDQRVSEVRYPGLPSHPSYQVVQASALNGGAVITFLAGADAETADKMIERLAVIHSATSLGGVESTIERRAKLSGQEHLPAALVRLSVGIEHIEDLWNDLDQALA